MFEVGEQVKYIGIYDGGLSSGDVGTVYAKSEFGCFVSFNLATRIIQKYVHASDLERVGLVIKQDNRAVDRDNAEKEARKRDLTPKDVTENKGNQLQMNGGGLRYNSGKPRMELLVAEAIEAEAKVWAFGAEKYGDLNWQKGMKFSTVIACILRHAFKILKGEIIDSESGLEHAAHIKCNASMLIYFTKYYPQGNDLTKTIKPNFTLKGEK